MDKTEAIELLGGTVGNAAAAIGISPQAVSLWPAVLSPAISDRVQAALWRKSNPPASGENDEIALEAEKRPPSGSVQAAVDQGA